MAKEGFDLMLRQRIVANMRRAMRDLKIGSGHELARRIKVDPSTITRYMSGARTPGLDLLYRLHRGLGISADFFLDTPTAVERQPPESPPPVRHLRDHSGRS